MAQKKIITSAVELSDKAAKALKTAEKANDGISKFIEIIGKVKENDNDKSDKGGEK